MLLTGRNRSSRSRQRKAFLAVGILFLTLLGSPLAASSELAWDQPHDARVATRNVVLTPETPLFEGERVVVSTIGVEHFDAHGETVFHPLVSFLVDRSFAEDPYGQWLAVYNLGHKSAGPLSHLGAFFPGFPAFKKSSGRAIKKMERKLARFQENPERMDLKAPKPVLRFTRQKRKANTSLVLSGIKRGLGTIIGFWPGLSEISFPTQLLYRNYLLRRHDRQERQFEQAYLGLTWYTDLAAETPDEDALSAAAIEEIKFLLLSNRNILGQWVDPLAKTHFVHGYESQMRDHLWGTSCYLASIANEYHLVYEEFHRYTAGGVPLALGGILYYDPRVAPEPKQAKWSTFNPFDLTYNPFTDRRVLDAAAEGDKVPLAVYVYQSNMALKPIIAIDFFSPDNPRLREMATYWRKLGNEAIGASGRFGLFFNLVRRAVSFSVNRKELSLFSDRKHSLGLEELRLSLATHLQFEPDGGDQLLDQLDRVIINPLVEPSRQLRARAELQYYGLLEDGGRKAIAQARKIRGQLIKKAVGKEVGGQMDRYRAYLDKRQLLRPLEVSLRDRYLPSVPGQGVTASLRALREAADGYDEDIIDFLLNFRLEMERSPSAPPRPVDHWIEETDRTLEELYAAAGRPPEELMADLRRLDELQQQEEEKQQAKWERDHANRFAKILKEQTRVLQELVDNQGDLTTVSSWYVADALEFFGQVPQVVALNPQAAVKFQPVEGEIRLLLQQVERHLEAPVQVAQADWLAEQRSACLLSVRSTRLQLDGPLSTTATERAAEVLQESQENW